MKTGNKIPFSVLSPLLQLMMFVCYALYLILWPVVFLYGMVLCVVTWVFGGKEGKCAVVVVAGREDSGPWVPRIRTLVEGRAVFLNYQERRNWRRWSLTVQLFHCFGPQPIPQSFMVHSLPAVILLKKFRLPKLYTFGGLSRDPETKLEDLRSRLFAK
jgi:hypothetical protein